MQNDKKEEPTRQAAAEPTTPGTAKDPDELVHEQAAEVPDAIGSEDLDELVHQLPTDTEPDPLQEFDPDDIVHSHGDDEDLEVGGEG